MSRPCICGDHNTDYCPACGGLHFGECPSGPRGMTPEGYIDEFGDERQTVTPKPGIPLNEPQTTRERVMKQMVHESWCEYSTTGACACEAGQALISLIANERAIEREARGIPLIDVELDDLSDRDKTVENLIIALAYRYDEDTTGRPCFCPTPDAIEADGTVIHKPRCRSARITLDRWSAGLPVEEGDR